MTDENKDPREAAMQANQRAFENQKAIERVTDAVGYLIQQERDKLRAALAAANDKIGELDQLVKDKMDEVERLRAEMAEAITKSREPEAEVKSERIVYLDQETFNTLYEYSSSLPTGTTIGKKWKRKCGETWWQGHYIKLDDDHVGIEWSRIVIGDPAKSEPAPGMSIEEDFAAIKESNRKIAQAAHTHQKPEPAPSQAAKPCPRCGWDGEHSPQCDHYRRSADTALLERLREWRDWAHRQMSLDASHDAGLRSEEFTAGCNEMKWHLVRKIDELIAEAKGAGK